MVLDCGPGSFSFLNLFACTRLQWTIRDPLTDVAGSPVVFEWCWCTFSRRFAVAWRDDAACDRVPEHARGDPWQPGGHSPDNLSPQRDPPIRQVNGAPALSRAYPWRHRDRTQARSGSAVGNWWSRRQGVFLLVSLWFLLFIEPLCVSRWLLACEVLCYLSFVGTASQGDATLRWCHGYVRSQSKAMRV